MSAKKKLTGAAHMKANGKTQVAIYLRDRDLAKVDAIAKREQCTRAGVVLNCVLNSIRGESK